MLTKAPRLLKQYFSKFVERKEVLNYQKPRSDFQIANQSMVKCMVIHPVLYPNKGPEQELYAAEEAVGLIKALYWTVAKGPFWNEEQSQQTSDVQQQKEEKLPELTVDSQGRAVNNRKFMKQKQKPRQLVDESQREALEKEGWTLSNETKVKDGEYIYSPYFQGQAYNGGVFMEFDTSESDDDLIDEWKNKLLRTSLAKSSLMKVKKIHGTYFFSKGRVQFLADYIQENQINAIFLNYELTPLQQRNLEKQLTNMINGRQMKLTANDSDYDSDAASTESDTDVQSEQQKEEKTIKVFDRYTIILQIFAKRAKTGLAKLQIELSFLNFAKTKLIRSGTAFQSLASIFEGDLMSAKEMNLEVVSAKQRRARGHMSGSGETQLEVQRRLINEKESSIKKLIETENQQRGMRLLKKKNIINTVPTIALIGYTNAGKSALMNCIVAKEVVQSNDMLFQTLSTTSRKITLVSGQRAILLDTIGFISDLPHELVESFKSTLDEVAQADLVLHIRDISHPCTELQKYTVLNVLKDLQYSQDFYSRRMIEVWNKIDLLKTPIDYDQIQKNDFPVVPISATLKMNIKQLMRVIEEYCDDLMGKQKYHLKHSLSVHGDRLRWLFENGNIIKINNENHGEEQDKNGRYDAFVEFDVQLDEVTYNRYLSTFNLQRPQKQNKGMPPPDWGKKKSFQ